MLLTETSIIYKGIRPLQKLGATASELAFNHPFANLTINHHVPDRLEVVPPDPWPGDSQRGRDLLAGIFRFAGHTVPKEEISWKPLSAKPEWVAELHGFEWLRDLRSVGGDRARRMARELMASWLEVYQKPDDLIWRADVMGVRLTSWISFHDFFCASADDTFRAQYFTSIARQARYLSRMLPGNITGIALMRALKGLAFTGIALEDGQERLNQAFKLILREIKEQVLPDGSHISRSPQSAFEFFKDLVDLRVALIAARIDMPEELQHAIDRMAPAIKFFRHPDGTLAHFNGTQEGNPHLCEATLMHSGARGKTMRSLPHGGYERLHLGRAVLVMDTGLPHMTRFSDRAHAGLFSFEYSYGRDRVIVNCGTSAVAGRWRDLLRGTSAHSTVTLDNRNNCQIDDKGFLTGRPDFQAKYHEDDDYVQITGEHKGYVPRFGLVHGRRVRLMEDGERMQGEDTLTGKSGVAYAVRFHLHPGIQASLIQEGDEVLLRSKSGTGWRFSAKGVKIAIEDSVYAGEGEMPRRAQQIVLSGMTESPVTALAWQMKREKF